MLEMDFNTHHIGSIDYLYALALFPNDVQKQHDFMLYSIMQGGINCRPDKFAAVISERPDMAMHLMQLAMRAGGDAQMGKDLDEALKKSKAVGGMFLTYYVIHEKHRDLAVSKNKLFYLFSRLAVQGYPTSEAGLRNYWREYSSVAHLSAALFMLGQDMGKHLDFANTLDVNNPSHDDILSHNENVFGKGILSTAEHFRLFAIKQRLVSKDETWSPPEHIKKELFNPIRSIILESIVLPTNTLDILAGYSVKKKYLPE